MNRGAIRVFARLIRRLSCNQLKRLLKKLSRRLALASSGGAFVLIFRRKLIKSLRTKIKMVKARIRVKCRPSSGGVFGGPQLQKCKREARNIYPMPSGGGFSGILARAKVMRLRAAYIRKCLGSTGGSWWSGVFNISQMNAERRAKLKKCIVSAQIKFPNTGGWSMASVIVKRRNYIKQCMGQPGFDGEWSNQSGLPLPYGTTGLPLPYGTTGLPLPYGTTGLPLPYGGTTTTTSPPNSIHTIPGQPYTSIPRPFGPIKPPLPTPYGPTNILPRPNVPYHTHSMIIEPANIRNTGGPIASPYNIPRPLPTSRPTPRPGPTPYPNPLPPASQNPTGLPGGLMTGPNFHGGVWGDEIDME